MPRWRFQSKAVSAVLSICLAVTANAQSGPNLSKKAEAIKHKAATLAANAPISVIPLHGAEEFGVFLSSSQEDFTFRDIDRKIDVTMKYSEVRKLKGGYGGYNSIQGRHTDRTKAIVVTLAVLGALGALIGAAATAKN
ncbi:MAG TPA: hypothetical protein VGI45_08215 [Terracidiphilus sp.]|jgi:hypothetical protein